MGKRLLILTQKVDKNDPILGFFHKWVEEFSCRFEKVIVICLEEGDRELPRNVEVLSLGKEEGSSRLKYLKRFFLYVWKLQDEYDAVFVHMNPEYVALGGLLWRALGKSVALWYVHRSVTWKLRLATLFSSVVFTSTRESLRLRSDKIRYVGHGIDTGIFKYDGMPRPHSQIVLHVGRITRIKRCEVLIGAFPRIKERFPNMRLWFVGPMISADDRLYRKELDRLAESYGGRIEFFDPVNQEALPELFRSVAVSVNMAPTGGMDKAVLESFAVGTPVVVSNGAFADFFGRYKRAFLFRSGDEADLAEKVAGALETDEETLRFFADKVEKEYSISAVVDRITKGMSHETGR